jgi:hypothetical protein
MTTYDEIRSLLEKLTNKIQVSFALYCAEDVYSLTKNSKEAKICIDLIKEWLRNPDRPGLREELRDAANAAYTAFDAYSATNTAIHAANTAFGAYDAVNVYDTAAYTAHSAACSTPYDEKLQEYYGVLVGYLTEVEKVLYSQEEK